MTTSLSAQPCGLSIELKTGIAGLRKLFPSGEADDLNIAIFDVKLVSAIHEGLIDETPANDNGEQADTIIEVTVIQPRRRNIYSVQVDVTVENAAFLYRLHESSRAWLAFRMGVDFTES